MLFSWKEMGYNTVLILVVRNNIITLTCLNIVYYDKIKIEV